MKRLLSAFKILAFLTICLAFGGLVSYIFILRGAPSGVFEFNSRVGGQQVYVSMALDGEGSFEYKLYSKNSWQIRSTIKGEYKIEDEQLYIKPNGAEDFSLFGKVNQFQIATNNIDFPTVGVSFAGDFKFDCKSEISKRTGAYAILFTGVGLSTAFLIAIITIDAIQKRSGKRKFKETPDRKEDDNGDKSSIIKD